MSKPRIAALAGALCLRPCSTYQKEVEEVAKDWGSFIRGSEVVPVYPLSEDVMPGDVFVVALPISEQATAYKEKGFLPLDQLAVRLRQQKYQDFYKDGYFKG